MAKTLREMLQGLRLLSLVIDKVGYSSSEDYRVVLVAALDSKDLRSLGTKLVQIKKKDNDAIVYKSYKSSIERACKKHLLGSDLEIRKDGRGIKVDFLAHVPDTVDALEMLLDLMEGSKEVAEKPKG